MLAVLGGVYVPVVSVVYTLMVARHLLTEELAALTVFNVGHATALTILGYVTVWCLCVFARRPERFAELAWAAPPASLLAWAFPAVYMAICGSSTLRF